MPSDANWVQRQITKSELKQLFTALSCIPVPKVSCLTLHYWEDISVEERGSNLLLSAISEASCCLAVLAGQQ